MRTHHGVFPWIAKAASLFILCVAAGAAAGAEESSNDQVAEAEQLTQSLVALSDHAAPAPQYVRDLAQRRRKLWLQLAETSPAEALRLAFPSGVAAKLPSSAKALVESDADEQGVLEVRVEDYADSHRMVFLLKTARERLQLYFAADPPRHMMTGSRVRARGKRLDSTLLLQAGPAPGTSGNASLQVLALASSNTFGAQSTVVILVNFQNNPAQPYTVSAAGNSVFNSTSNFYNENSQNQTWLVGNVYGWFTIAMSSTACNPDQLALLANQAATNAGVVLSNYRRIVYGFPLNACGWSGLGTIGGNPSKAWLNGSISLGLIAHEIGHNFGLYHSHALNCNGSVLGPSCSSIEYGDKFDTMGNATSAHYNAFQKERLGWLNYGSSLPITTVPTSGTYTIPPYETTSGSKALKILKALIRARARKPGTTWSTASPSALIAFSIIIPPLLTAF